MAKKDQFINYLAYILGGLGLAGGGYYIYTRFFKKSGGGGTGCTGGYQLAVNGYCNSVTVSPSATLNITVTGATPNAQGGQSLQFYYETICGTFLGAPSFLGTTDASGTCTTTATLTSPPAQFYLQAYDVLLQKSNCVLINT